MPTNKPKLEEGGNTAEEIKPWISHGYFKNEDWLQDLECPDCHGLVLGIYDTAYDANEFTYCPYCGRERRHEDTKK